jgi:ribosomal-protein-alanine N-acetyltransferase
LNKVWGPEGCNPFLPAAKKSLRQIWFLQNLDTDVIVNIEEKIKTLDQHLETERLHIKPLKASDAVAAFPKLQDDDLYRWISLIKPKSVNSLAEDWRRIESRTSPDHKEIWLAWFVSSKFDNSPLGSIDVSIDEDGVAVNCGYYFFVSEWGKGYGTEATSAVIQHLQKHQVKKFIATVTVGNMASVAVLKKLGFEFVRTIPNNDTLNGVLVDDDEYVLLTSRC